MKTWMALFTSDGLEVGAEDYARQPYRLETRWPLAETAWGTVVAIGIFDAEKGGNLLFESALTLTIGVFRYVAPVITTAPNPLMSE